MTLFVQTLQILSGALWLLPAVYLSPRVWRSWQADHRRIDILSAPICFFAWLQVGFIVRWFAWQHSVAGMGPYELAAWGALYALSAFLALWVFRGGQLTQGDR